MGIRHRIGGRTAAFCVGVTAIAGAAAGLVPTWLVLPVIMAAVLVAETSVFTAQRKVYLAERRARAAAAAEAGVVEAVEVEELDEAA